MFLCDGGQGRLYYGGAAELKPKKYQRALGVSGGQRKHKYEGQSRTSLGISGTKSLWHREMNSQRRFGPAQFVMILRDYELHFSFPPPSASLLVVVVTVCVHVCISPCISLHFARHTLSVNLGLRFS